MTKNSDKPCLYPTCTKRRHKRFWCNPHYIQQRRHGFESMWSSTAFETCVYLNCARKPFSRALCNKHYKYIYSDQMPESPDKVFNIKLQSCSVIGCEKKPRRTLMCAAHEDICRKYNVSTMQLSATLISQQFKCKICDSSDRKLFVDHDHACCHEAGDSDHYKRCGQCNRGLVCGLCNFGLAAFMDNAKIIKTASEYFDNVVDVSHISDSMGVDEPGSRTWQCRWYRYRIGPNRYNYLMNHLKNKCPICKEDFKEIHLDHCHSKGIMRMPLCRSCNHGLGYVKDNVDTLLSMIQYLVEYKNRRDSNGRL